MGIEVIVPNARFHCNGRITHFQLVYICCTGIVLILHQFKSGVLLQFYSSTYVKIGEVKLPEEISDYENDKTTIILKN